MNLINGNKLQVLNNNNNNAYITIDIYIIISFKQ